MGSLVDSTSTSTTCAKVHRTPYGHTPNCSNDRHAIVLNRGRRKSSSPCAKTHLGPYGQKPCRANFSHGIVLYFKCGGIEKWRRN